MAEFALPNTLDNLYNIAYQEHSSVKTHIKSSVLFIIPHDGRCETQSSTVQHGDWFW